ncbi:Acyl-CoA dehydrogenase [Rhodococcus erythropolis]|uniref:acyl-CoA dehydrogenase family protein n=1 Tax=Rhodococcus erythropolis TaxID=1833 RepID=UPI000BB39AA2|nr:acyl-CoA dehydrogenase family protein [Rhodococcus erythropolis]PBI91956.1 Acyl-CoA dehydrogenase [Rhodococcus erythropolis]
MNFELSDEQQSLKQMTRDLLSRSYDYAKVAQVAGGEVGWSSDVWKALGETGILGLCVDEDHGGAGAGVRELAVVAEELGRALAPEPVLDGAVLPAEVIGRAGSDEQIARWVPALAAGEVFGALVSAEEGEPVGQVASRTDAGYVVSGRTMRVRNGHQAQVLVVSALLDGVVALFLVDSEQSAVGRVRYRSHDRNRGAHIEFDCAVAELLPVGDSGQVLAAARALAHAALCAEAVGVMDAALSMTVEYLKARRQFGAPLSTRQALAHRVADLFVLVESARSMALYAVGRLAAGVVDESVVSRADLQICRSGRVLAHECIHLHGGIGVTDEHPIGHLASRLISVELRVGGADAHLDVLADSVDSYSAVMAELQ